MRSIPLTDDFISFARFQIAIGDVDPAYPVLRHLQRNMGREAALWHTFLYVAFYNLASAVEAFAACPTPNCELSLDLASRPTGIERRGLRGGYSLQMHLASLRAHIEANGSIYAFLAQAQHNDPAVFYLRLRDEVLRMVWGNGRWAAYKTSEILQKVNGLPIEATDMGNDGSTGPKAGLELLYGPANGVREMDRWGRELQAILADAGLPVPIDEVETLLCDFHSFKTSDYYPGHDIDEMAHVLMRSPRPDLMGEVWEARAASFPVGFLVEADDHFLYGGQVP